MSSTVIAAIAGAVLVATAAPYLSGVTLTAPDRGDRRWWRSAWAARSGHPRRVFAAAGIGALAGAAGGVAAGWDAAWPAFMWLALTVTPLVITDIEHKRLPDALLAVGGAGAAGLLAIAAVVDTSSAALVRAAVAAAVVFLVFLMMTLAGAIKFGDAKLEALLGCYLGWLGWRYVVVGVVAGFIIAAAARTPLLLARRTSMREDFAFGPYLIAGALIAGLWSL